MVIPRYLSVFPRVIVIFENISIFFVNVRRDARDNFIINMQYTQVVNMTQYSALFTFYNFFHHAPIIFVSLLADFSSLLKSFSQKSSDASRVPYVDSLASVYMYFLLQISIQMKFLYQVGSISSSKFTTSPSILICMYPLS